MNSLNSKQTASLKKRARALKWACEPLERRWLLSTVTWTTQGNGNWTDASNWTDDQGVHRVPAADGSDDVVINVAALNIVVTYNGSGLALGNLVNDEILDIVTGTASWNSGTWDGSGVVEVDSTLNISGSSDKIIRDGEGIENLGTINLSGTGNIRGQVGASITNEPGATFNATSDADITFDTGVGDGIFQNAGTFIKSGAGTTTDIGGPQGFRFENSITETLIPKDSTPGDVQVLSGTLALGDDQNVALTEGGTYEISNLATLDFNRGQHQIVVLRPDGAPADVIPSISGPGGPTAPTTAGTLEVSGTANVQFYGNLDVDEVDVRDSGTLLLNQNMDELNPTTQKTTNPSTPGTLAGFTNTLTLSNSGTFGGNGGGIFPAPPNINNVERPLLEVKSSFSWSGGTLSGLGRLQIDPEATATITTSTAKAIDGGFGLDLFDQDIWTGSCTISMNGSSVIFIHSTGSLVDEGDGTINEGTVDVNGGSIWNMGNFAKNGGTATTTVGTGINVINDINPLNFVTAAVPVLEPTGTDFVIPPVPPSTTPTLIYDVGSDLLAKISVVTGTLSLQGTSTNLDNILISPNATLDYENGPHLNEAYVDSNDVDNASILGHNNGSLVFGNNVIFTADHEAILDVANVTFGGGIETFDNTAGGAQVIQNGIFNGENSGIIGGSGTLEVGPVGGNGTFLWNSGTFNGSGNLLIDPGATLTLPSGASSTSGGYSILNDGTMNWGTSPGQLTISGNFTQTSTGFFDTEVVGAPPLVDSLSVNGNVTIAGGLNLTLGSYTPIDGQVYTVIASNDSNPINGTFAMLPQGSIITKGSTQFIVSYIGGDGNDLVLTAIVFPAITIATPDPIVNAESGTTDLQFVVTLTPIVEHTVTVQYTTSNLTATGGVDYVATTGTLTILPGQKTGVISIPIIGTTLIEPTRTFTVTLSSPSEATLGSPSSAIGTILNVNGPPLILLSQSSYTVDEGTGSATITVVRTDSSIPVSVNYATASGTAIAGVDFTAVSGKLSFGSGVALLTFTVPLLTDPNIGDGKSFTVTLSNAQGSGASIGIANATVNIVNDTNLPQISIGSVTVTEPIAGTVSAVFPVTVSMPVASGFTIQYRTVDGTATAGIEYGAQSGTLTFAPNQLTADITITVNSDFVQNTIETFSVLLSGPSSNEGLQNATGTGTIINQQINSVTLDAQHPYRYKDARGNMASIILRGPGSGVIDYLGLPSNDAKQVVLNNTTAQSQLQFTSTGKVSYIVNVIVNGSIKSIIGPTLDLQGNLDVTGSVQTLHLNSLIGGNTITIGAGSTLVKGVSAIFNQVTNSTLTSSLPLTLLKVNGWQDTNTGIDISAPSAVAINSTGNFQAEVNLTGNLGTLTVGGSMNASTIDVGGSINTIAAGSITGSTIFAGVDPSVTTLPTSTSQFADASSAINHLTVRPGSAGTFSNTLIAAPIVGVVQLNAVNISNGGTPFGIAAESIHSAKGKDPSAFTLTDANLLAGPFSHSDFQIHLTD